MASTFRSNAQPADVHRSTGSFAALAQFGPQHFAFVSDVLYPWRLQFADLNGDGHADVISNGVYEHYLWAGDGTGQSGDRRVLITQSLNGSDRPQTVDVDVDGDQDVVYVSPPDYRT